MHACMYVLYAHIRVFVHLCVYACMYICMHVCTHVCIYVIFKLGLERYGGNCPSWEGELSGGELSGGKCPGELSRGEMSGPPNTHRPTRTTAPEKANIADAKLLFPILHNPRGHVMSFINSNLHS